MGLLLFSAILLPALLGVVLSFLKGEVKRFAGPLSSLITFASFLCIFLIYLNIDLGQTVLVSIPWAPSLNVNFSFIIDGLSLFFGFLVTGIGTLVNFYAHYYMAQSDQYLRRFYVYLNFFTSAMLGCVFADNLLVMFLFWELTSVTSFLLIGYSFTEKLSQISARMVFLVVSLTSFVLLIGILIIGILNETFLWTEIVTQGIAYGNQEPWQTIIILCFMIGIFGKSAQIPFHFWLPNAMCAPTPISAYLHAATMVKLGVFLTARMYPLFVTSEIWFPLLMFVCLSTMLIGAVLSLLSNDLKGILAYATVSQLGFFLSVYGMGDEEGVGYDFVHILNHAFYKGSLFMLVGILNHATGIRDIRRLGGLWHALPATMVIFFIATLAMAGVPGTTGFIGKELILRDLVIIETNFTAGLVIMAVIMSASVFKVAFSIRLFYHIFIREKKGEKIPIHKPVWQVLLAPGILSMAALIFGIWPAGLGRIVESFYVSGLHMKELPELQVWHGWTLELMISTAILSLGIFLFYLAERWQVWSIRHPFPDFGLLWNGLMDKCVAIALSTTLLLKGSTVHRHLIVLLLFFAAGVGGILVSNDVVPWSELFFFPGSIYRWAALIMIAGSTLSIPFLPGGLPQALALASSGFFVTLYFVFYQAPDLAMTQILIEVVTGIMLLVMVWVFGHESNIKERRVRTFLRIFTAFLVSAAGTSISLAYSGLKGPKPLSEYFIASTVPLAKGANAVNTILVDFRSLDTLGEITVLLIAAIAIVGLVSRNQKPSISWDSKLILVPSIILRTLTPTLFFMIHLFALYLLIRGHNQAGGGFVAGVASGIAFILVGFSLQLQVLKKMIPVNLLLLSGSGVALALLISLIPTLWGSAFLERGPLHTQASLLFDIGVFIVVLGITMISIIALRADAFREEEWE